MKQYYITQSLTTFSILLTAYMSAGLRKQQNFCRPFSF